MLRIKITGKLKGESAVTLGICDTLEESTKLINEYNIVFGSNIVFEYNVGEHKRKPIPRVAYSLAILMFSLNFMNINLQPESYYSWLNRTKYKQF